ncbi:GNAT family N-acetyltransferase [Kitasatospora sp. NPDC004240]
MTWTLSRDPRHFLDQAGDHLAADPARNTVLLTVLDRVTTQGLDVFGDRPPVFGWWRPEAGAPVEGAFLRTPPYEPRLGVMPLRAAAELAAELAAARGPFAELTGLPGIAGGTEEARAFAAAWQSATGATSSVKVGQRLYRLGDLTGPPRPPAGRHRAAGPADRELLVRWTEEFHTEVGLDGPGDAAGVDARIADGRLHLWEDGGQPVAMAGDSPVIAGMSRIGPVYTPRAHRGRGYASGATFAATAHALGRGAKEVLLYTDLANPTSNSIYQQIGYRPVADDLVLSFTH